MKFLKKLGTVSFLIVTYPLFLGLRGGSDGKNFIQNVKEAWRSV